MTAVLFHLALGALFGCIGFLQPDGPYLRQTVGGLGLMLVLGMGTALAFSLLMWEPLLSGPTRVTGWVVGLASIPAARYLPNQEEAP